MRRIVLWVAATAIVLVLLFGYRTSTSSKFAIDDEASVTSPLESGATVNATTTATRIGVPGTPSDMPSGPAYVAGTVDPATVSSTFAGPVVQTVWGPVQVELVVTAGVIAQVSVVQYPHENPRDIFINETALPILLQDTLDSQSADIDMVGGATVTSDGYVSSLQEALDKAGI